MNWNAALIALPLLTMLSDAASARTVWRCLRDGTVSLATAPEPGSKCTANTLDDNAAALPNLWGALGVFHGTLYQREQDGKTVYSTRNLPGSTKVLQFTVATPPSSPAHAGLGTIGKPQLGIYRREFTNAARVTGLDEAWLRAIAHAESAYAADAVSTKGAKGIMQLMPDVIGDYGVGDPFSAKQSIMAGAKLLKALEAQTAFSSPPHTTPAAVRSRNTAVYRRMSRRRNMSSRSASCIHAIGKRWASPRDPSSCSRRNDVDPAPITPSPLRWYAGIPTRPARVRVHDGRLPT